MKANSVWKIRNTDTGIEHFSAEGIVCRYDWKEHKGNRSVHLSAEGIVCRYDWKEYKGNRSVHPTSVGRRQNSRTNDVRGRKSV